VVLAIYCCYVLFLSYFPFFMYVFLFELELLAEPPAITPNPSVLVAIISADALAVLQVTTKFFRCVSVLGLRKSEVRPVSVPDACHGWWSAQVFS